MTVKEFLAIRKEEGLKIDPSTAEVDWNYAQGLAPMASIPNFQRIAIVWVGHTLLADPVVTFGSSLATCQRRRVTRCGNGINPNWHFLLGSKTLPSRTDDADTVTANAHGAGRASHKLDARSRAMKCSKRSFAVISVLFALLLSLSAGTLNARDAASHTFAAAQTAKQKCINTCRARYRDCLRLNQLPSFECRGVYRDCTRYVCTGLGPG